MPKPNLYIVQTFAPPPLIQADVAIALAGRIKPLVRFAKGERGCFISPHGWLYRIKPVDIFKSAFLETAQRDKPVRGMDHSEDIHVYCRNSSLGNTHVTIHEVLSQIPTEALSLFVAFEVVETVPVIKGSLEKVTRASEMGYSTIKVRLWAGKENGTSW